MKLSDIKKVHFIGIGGIGMSALARLFFAEKKIVSGSDRSPSDITRALRNEGVEIFEGHAKENVHTENSLVVYTEAVSEKTEGYVELQIAREKGIPTINYFDALGMVANEYYLIAVAGSHGKTTTTAMIIDIFESAGFDPSAVVGSLRAQTKSNYRAGKSKYFIVEACEYKRDFLSLTPDILVITNIEHEHVDYYKDLADVQKAFREFALQVREEGVVIANLADEKVRPCVEHLFCTVIDYGKYFNPLLLLKVPGVHNQMNAAAAKATAEYSGISQDVATHALEHFSGTWRRFEYKGEVNGAKVYDDYGHHPTEIEATLKGAQELYPDKKIVLVFQSHTYSRTFALFDNFARALALADEVHLLPIYAAREENESGVTHTQLAEKVQSAGTPAHAYDSFDEVVDMLKKEATPDMVVLVMGAGDITKVSDMLTK